MQMQIFFQLDRLWFVNVQPEETKAAAIKDNITDIFKRLDNLQYVTGEVFFFLYRCFCVNKDRLF